jgi:hypothetical protein
MGTVSKEAYSIHVDQEPALARLVARVRETRRPLHVRDDRGDLAVLMPVAFPETRRRSRSPEAVIAQLRASHGSVAPRRRPEDFRALRREFEEGVAEEVAGETP